MNEFGNSTVSRSGSTGSSGGIVGCGVAGVPWFAWAQWQLTRKRFKLNDDGTKEIQILRYWWGAKSAGSPQLYQQESYTWDGHVRPLDYIIAPGTYVNEVAQALTGGTRGGTRPRPLARHRGRRRLDARCARRRRSGRGQPHPHEVPVDDRLGGEVGLEVVEPQRDGRGAEPAPGERGERRRQARAGAPPAPQR